MPNNCFSQIYVFGTRRTLVFFIFMRSAGAEQLFFSFLLVRHLPNEHFSCFWLFGGCRIAVFFIFGCSAPAEQAFSENLLFPGSGTRRIFIILQEYYGNGITENPD